jgi:hypothetical protein
MFSIWAKSNTLYTPMMAFERPTKWLAGLSGIVPAAGSLGLGSSMSSIAMMGTGAAVGAGAMVGAAGAGGYGLGTMGYGMFLEGTDFADKLGEVLAKAAAWFGVDDAKRAIEINLAIDQQGRVVADSNDLNTTVKKAALPRGEF